MDEAPVPIAFYGHFKDIDDLGLSVSREISSQLRQPPRDLRRKAALRAQHASQGVGPQLPANRALAEEQIVMLCTGASVLQSLGQLKSPIE